MFPLHHIQRFWPFVSLLTACGGQSVEPITGTSAFVPCGWVVEQVSATKAFALLPHDEMTPAVYDGVATFSIENLASHEAAMAKLLLVAGESSAEPKVQLTRGWPALSRQYAARVDRESAGRIGSKQGEWIAVTCAIAAGAQLVRVEARIHPGRDEEAASIIRMGLSFKVPAPPPTDSQAMSTELDLLSKRVALAVPGPAR